MSKIFMRSQHRRWLWRTCFGILILALGCPLGLGQNSVSELFRRMQIALGGADKLIAIRDFDQFSEAETLDRNGATIHVQKRVRWIKPNQLRVDQLGPFDTYVLYFDGNSGWEILPDGTLADLKGGELEFARKYLASLDVKLWLADRLSGYSILSPAAIVIRISIQDDPNKQVEITVDPVTFLPVKDSSISLGNPRQPTPTQHEFYEWVTVNGVRFPREISIIQNGRNLGKLTTRRVRINTGLNLRELSKKPADLKPVLGLP